MQNVFRILCWSTVIVWMSACAIAQINPVYQTIQKNRQHAAPKQLVKPLKPEDPMLRDLGYNDSTIVQLQQRAGVDLTTIRDKRVWNENEKAALSDCIVIGKVVKVEYPYDFYKRRHHFQAITYVIVEEYLLNNYQLPKRPIPVVIASGPHGMIMGEDTLGVGEHVLLFLSAIGYISFVENNEPAYFRELINTPIIRFRILGFDGKYAIHSGCVYNKREEDSKDLVKVKEEILKTVMILHPTK